LKWDCEEGILKRYNAKTIHRKIHYIKVKTWKNNFNFKQAGKVPRIGARKFEERG
jgi:hypothetical protein